MGEQQPSFTAVGAADSVAEAARIRSLDVLRGFALLGILLMNIQSFSMIEAAYIVPTAYGDLTGANFWVWYLCAVLADSKFMTIFSLLFGAGIVLLSERREAAAGRSAAVHYRRMGVLLLFGLLHGYLLWYGDILYDYALCGLGAYLLRRLRPWLLLVLGLLLLAVGSAISVGTYVSLPHWPAKAQEEFVEDFRPDAETIAEDAAKYRGGWVTEFQQRWPETWSAETEYFAFIIVWRAGGLMLAGMALYKLGVFSAALSRRTYRVMVAVGMGLGLPVIACGILRNFQESWEPRYAVLLGSQYNYWGSLLVSLGWIGLVMLVCQSERLRPWTRPLAAVGQTAFTNYLLQTLICTTLFYGHGFGLYGRVERVGQILIVFAVWAFQLLAAPLWLRYFQLGPAEWLWRSLTYLRPQPLRRRSHPQAV